MQVDSSVSDMERRIQPDMLGQYAGKVLHVSLLEDKLLLFTLRPPLLHLLPHPPQPISAAYISPLAP